ncbi:MAG: ice-binding family protein [Pseudolysinimonas sp.]|uniref:ice-binding family protein n=1 Tax=Pseudolysinimonas sp. TaxID=2680009 RepID=UPI003262E950
MPYDISVPATAKRSRRPLLIAVGTMLAVGSAILFAPLAASAAEPGDDDFLGSAEDYSVIASDTITDTATHGTQVEGNVGLTPGTDQQLGDIQVGGDIHVNDTAATTADADLNIAYVILANTAATDVVGTTNLAANPLPYGPGVYQSASDLLLDGTITLSGAADDVWIFQASTGSLTVGSNSVVLLVGGAQSCNVYWQVGSSATIGTNATFVGTVVAATSISALTGATIQGQLLAGATNAGAVTLDNNLITMGSPCVRQTSTERIAAEESGGTGGTGGSGTGGTDGTTSTSGSSGSRNAGSHGASRIFSAPQVLASTGVDAQTTMVPSIIAALLLLITGTLVVVVPRLVVVPRRRAALARD